MEGTFDWFTTLIPQSIMEMFQRKPLRLRKYQERLESYVKERRISIASCESESGISWPITLCKLEAGSTYSTCKLNISRTLLESFKVHYNISSLFHKFSLALLALSNIRNKFLSEYIHIILLQREHKLLFILFSFLIAYPLEDFRAQRVIGTALVQGMRIQFFFWKDFLDFLYLAFYLALQAR